MRLLFRVSPVVFVLGLALGWPAVRAELPEGKEQIWEGTLKLRPGVELRLVIRLKEQGVGDPVAVLESPDEGLKGLKLSSVRLDKSRLTFELKVTGAKYDGKLNAAGTEAVGEWTQRGAKLPLTFTKKDRPNARAEDRGQGTDLGREAADRRGDRVSVQISPPGEN